MPLSLDLYFMITHTHTHKQTHDPGNHGSTTWHDFQVIVRRVGIPPPHTAEKKVKVQSHCTSSSNSTNTHITYFSITFNSPARHSSCAVICLCFSWLMVNSISFSHPWKGVPPMSSPSIIYWSMRSQSPGLFQFHFGLFDK